MDEDFFFSRTSRPLADFLWITQASPHEMKRPRIGIVLKEKEDPKGVWIERIMPESPAEKAGLLPGDQFVSIDGKEVQSLKDIHDAVAHKGSGKRDRHYHSPGGSQERDYGHPSVIKRRMRLKAIR